MNAAEWHCGSALRWRWRFRSAPERKDLRLRRLRRRPHRCTATPNLDVLKGTWVRPDGGYVIGVKGVGADGRVDATYFNPNQLPFAKAQASSDGGVLRVVLVLQAGGYAGSTYELRYDPASDRLQGTYYQAVAQQKFDVYFARR